MMIVAKNTPSMLLFQYTAAVRIVCIKKISITDWNNLK